MIRKFIGYLIALVGIAAIALSVMPEYLPLVPFPELKNIPNLYLTIGGVVITIIGLFIVTRSSSHGSRGLINKGPREVPIYHGRQIVGYRRH